MSFRELVRDLLANTALPILDDIPVECFVQHGGGEPMYDTTTGDALDNAVAESKVNLILSPVGKNNPARPDKQNVPIGDIEALALDVSQFVVKPASGDLLTMSGSEDQYVVLDVQTDEMEATYTLTLKRTGGGASDDVQA